MKKRKYLLLRRGGVALSTKHPGHTCPIISTLSSISGYKEAASLSKMTNDLLPRVCNVYFGQCVLHFLKIPLVLRKIPRSTTSLLYGAKQSPKRFSSAVTFSSNIGTFIHVSGVLFSRDRNATRIFH